MTQIRKDLLDGAAVGSLEGRPATPTPRRKPIRASALRHALLPYVFGAVIIAITIYVVAGFLTK